LFVFQDDEPTGPLITQEHFVFTPYTEDERVQLLKQLREKRKKKMKFGLFFGLSSQEIEPYQLPFYKISSIHQLTSSGWRKEEPKMCPP
jgi:hypothetical protein